MLGSDYRYPSKICVDTETEAKVKNVAESSGIVVDSGRRRRMGAMIHDAHPEHAERCHSGRYIRLYRIIPRYTLSDALNHGKSR